MQISNRRKGDVATSAEQEFVARPLDTKAVASDEKTRTRRVVLLRIAALAAVIMLLTVVAYRLGWFDLRRATATVERLQSGRDRLSVAVLFFVIFAATTAVGFPALPFTVAGGVIFGYLMGSALSWAAALVGTMLGYALARGVGREPARHWLAKRSVGEAGLARTRFSTYVAASAIGILPTTVVFAYFADSLVRGLQGARTHAYWDVSIASTVLLMITMVPFVAKRIGLKAG